MLTRVHKILIGLFALQLALVAIVLLRGGDPPLAKDKPLLAGFDPAKVTRVRLFGPSADKPGVDLVKKGPVWIVASHSDYPADTAKVTGMLEPMKKIAAGDPIATSAGRHKQLRVGDKDFDRKIVLDVEGAGERTIHIGNPVGTRRTAIRIGGSEVYAATDVSTFQADPAGFVGTKYVDLQKADIERVALRRGQTMIELARESAAPAGSGSAGSGSAAGSAAAPMPTAAPTWAVTIDGNALKLGAGESLDTDAIDRILGQVTSIDLRKPADPKRDASAPTATITLHKKGVEQPVVLDAIADGESYWVRQRDLDRAILVDKGQLAEAIELERDKLVKKPPLPAPPGAGTPSPHGAIPGLPPGVSLPPGALPPGVMPPPPAGH